MMQHHGPHDAGRPFTMRVREAYKFSSFQRLAERCEGARSAAWFNNLINSNDPWVVSPPPQHTWAALARGLDMDEGMVRTAVAMEWFGIQGRPVESPRPKPKPNELELLSPADHKLVLGLIRRLADIKATEDTAMFASVQDLIDSAPDFGSTT